MRSMAQGVKVWVAYLILSSLTVSCGQSFTDQSKLTATDVGIFKISVQEGDVPLAYQVEIRRLQGLEPFTVFRTEVLSQSVEQVVLGAHDYFLDDAVESGRSYRYEIGVYTPTKEFRLDHREEVTIPLDIVLRGNETAELPASDESGILFLNRVQLEAGSALLTQGRVAKLRIGQLVSSGGEIRSFASDQKAQAGRVGRSGGELILDISHGLGSLKIALQGEHGGDGLTPLPPAPLSQGPQNGVGSEGLALQEYSSMSPGLANEECLRVPGRGIKGITGRPGLPGREGLLGGDSGSALVRVRAGSFKVTYSLEAGLGGLGSPGGPGGLGGPGGPSGPERVQILDKDNPHSVTSFLQSPPQICPKMNGPRGDQGPSGSPGSPGKPGSIRRICFQVSGETKCSTDQKGEFQ